MNLLALTSSFGLPYFVMARVRRSTRCIPAGVNTWLKYSISVVANIHFFKFKLKCQEIIVTKSVPIPQCVELFHPLRKL